MREVIEEYVISHHQETMELLKELAAIPGFSGQEEKRAVFVKNWLQKAGAREVFLDKAGNVVFPYRGTPGEKWTVVMAHMDVVCPDTTPLPIREENGCLIGPGVRDDTANLVNMLMAVKCLLIHPELPVKNLLFVADVGEEGLGNLKGSRQIFQDYGKDIKEWLGFDVNYNMLCVRAVGSRRYRVTVRTKGGHSFKDFGEKNAIAELASVIGDLYQADFPSKPQVTFNVGTIEGGTSVNTIASEAQMLYEFRSELEEAVLQAEAFFYDTIRRHQTEEVKIEVEVIGIRPGNGKTSEKEQRELEDHCMEVIKTYYDGEVKKESGSTDANIPLSEGIPAVTLGTAMGVGTHTREETVEIESMIVGQKIALGVLFR